jgi:hypothetical protein
MQIQVVLSYARNTVLVLPNVNAVPADVVEPLYPMLVPVAAVTAGE